MYMQTALPGRVAMRSRPTGLRLSALQIWAGAIGLAVIALALALAFVFRPAERPPVASVVSNPVRAAASPWPASVVPLADPQDLMPIAPAEALAINAARPIEVAKVDAASPLVVDRIRPEVRQTALQCLTSALYYEAGSESDDGQRAVAQVILNRVRHPAFPSSVCGVVYQGSHRTTGCQFTFTCDGSLMRVPSAGGWARSRKLAEGALSGRVYAPVGHATQYHADYVVPYWASSFDKVQVIGRHIFYRIKGRAGARTAFRQRYAALETIPGINPVSVSAEPEAASDLTADLESPRLVADLDTALRAAENKGELRTERNAPSRLLADAQAGRLLATPVRQGRSPSRAPTTAGPVVAGLGESTCDLARPAAPAKPLDTAASRPNAPQTDLCS